MYMFNSLLSWLDVNKATVNGLNGGLLTILFFFMVRQEGSIIQLQGHPTRWMNWSSWLKLKQPNRLQNIDRKHPSVPLAHETQKGHEKKRDPNTKIEHNNEKIRKGKKRRDSKQSSNIEKGCNT